MFKKLEKSQNMPLVLEDDFEFPRHWKMSCVGYDGIILGNIKCNIGVLLDEDVASVVARKISKLMSETKFLIIENEFGESRYELDEYNDLFFLIIEDNKNCKQKLEFDVRYEEKLREEEELAVQKLRELYREKRVAYERFKESFRYEEMDLKQFLKY